MLFKILTKSQLISLSILSLIVIIAFGSTYQNEFLGMDDHVYVWDNPYIRDGLTIEGIVWAFKADLTTQSEFADYWQPVTFISRMIDISLFKFNAGAHHMMNLFFHLCNVWLLYFFILRVFKSHLKSLLITSLFALHPLHAEIIGWTTARKDVLSVFFGLLSMHVYLWHCVKKSAISTIILAFSFALSLMAKPMMITLPILLLTFDMYRLNENNVSITIKNMFRHLLNKWPLFIMIICYLPIPFLGQPQAFEYDVNHPLVKGIVGYVFYLGKILLPLNLSLYGPIPELPIAWWKFFVSLGILLILFKTSVSLRKKSRLLIVGYLWFIIASVPIIGLTWPADRFMYLPMIGVWIMIIGLCDILFKNDKIVITLISVWLLFFAIQSFRQITVWRNDDSLMNRALEFSSENYSAHNVLGVTYAKNKEDTRALYHLNEAIRIRPDRDKPYNNIGLILEQQERFEEAIKYYEESVKRNPKDFRTINNIGIVYVRTNRFDEGISYFQEALKLNPKA
ncbi:MAG: hypothetical protein ACI9E5_000693, partial [Candidatus Omnitrophota bacterium]